MICDDGPELLDTGVILVENEALLILPVVCFLVDIYIYIYGIISSQERLLILGNILNFWEV